MSGAPPPPSSVHGLERWATARVARLLCLTESEARAVVAMAGGGCVTLRALRAALELSPGAAWALAGRLAHDAVVVREPDPDRPHEAALRLTDAAARELGAALAPLADRLEAIAAGIRATR
jgi:hypothetical protein